MAKKVEEIKLGDDIWEQYTPILKSRVKGTKGHQYDVYLTSGIEAPAAYNELIHILKNATKKDQINLMINNGGGYVDSGFMISNYIHKSKAVVTARLEGMVASIATVITLACDNIIVGKNVHFMIHNYSHGVQGSGNQVKNYVTFTDRELSKTFNKVYKGFLSLKEINKVTKEDKEIWLNDKQVEERLRKIGKM